MAALENATTVPACRRVKGYCHQRGLHWSDSLARTACGEQEYYEDLIRFYRSSLRVSLSVHLSTAACAVLHCDTCDSNAEQQQRLNHL